MPGRSCGPGAPRPLPCQARCRVDRAPHPASAFAAAATATSLTPLQGRRPGSAIDSRPRQRPPAALAGLAERAADPTDRRSAAAARQRRVDPRRDPRRRGRPHVAAVCRLRRLRGYAGDRQVTPLTQDEIVSWQAVRDELLPRLWQHLGKGAHERHPHRLVGRRAAVPPPLFTLRWPGRPQSASTGAGPKVHTHCTMR